MRFLLLISLFFIASCVSVTPKKAHVNHMALSVAELERSRAFYQDFIGLDTIPEPFHDGRHVWLSIGDKAQLHLIQNPPPILTPSKNTHICFSVKDVNTLVQKLQSHRVAYEDWPGKANAITTRADGIHQVYFQDPDGYWIEVNDDY